MNKHAPLVQISVSIGLLVTTILAIFNAWSEYRVSHLVALERNLTQRGGTPADYYALLSARDYSPSARGALIIGSLLTRAARKESGETALVYSEGAQAYLEKADVQRPGWAQVTLTRLYGLGNNTPLQPTLSPGYLLALSYRQAPYLTKEGPWRISQIIKFWNEVDDNTRAAAASEAVYLAHLSRASRVHIRLIVSHTPIEPLVKNQSEKF